MLDYAFYSANSGLAPASKFTLDDHMLAYWRIKAGISTGSIDDAQSKVFVPSEYSYIQSQTSGTGSLSDLYALYYSGGTPAPSAGLGQSALGTAPLGA